MSETAGIIKLLDKLTAARFSGTLTIRMESGAVASAELVHFLAFSEFQTKVLPTVEAAEFELKP